MIPKEVTANTGFVGIRIPSHPLALKLIQIAGVPIAAPSANRFGHVSPTKANHVMFDFHQHGAVGQEILVLDGEEGVCENNIESCDVGIESTVIKLITNDKKVYLVL